MQQVVTGSFLLRWWSRLSSPTRRFWRRMEIGVALETFKCLMSRCVHHLLVLKRLEHLEEGTVGGRAGRVTWVMAHKSDVDIAARIRGGVDMLTNVRRARYVLEFALPHVEREACTLADELAGGKDGVLDVGDLEVDSGPHGVTVGTGKGAAYHTATIMSDGIALRVLHGPGGHACVEAKLNAEGVRTRVHLRA